MKKGFCWKDLLIMVGLLVILAAVISYVVYLPDRVQGVEFGNYTYYKYLPQGGQEGKWIIDNVIYISRLPITTPTATPITLR